MESLGLGFCDSENLIGIQSEGDSMEPTIKKGAMLLIEKSDISGGKDAVYALRFPNGSISVKRLRNLYDGRVEVISDNPAYKILTAQLQTLDIVGRVVWCGQKF